MKPIRLILTVAEDNEFGGVGFLLPGCHAGPDMNPATRGALLAHDILEHVNGPANIGTIADELEAMGALWFVRGQFDDISRDGLGSAWNATQSIGHELVRMFRDGWYGDSLPSVIPQTRECDEDQSLKDAIEFAAARWDGEFDPEDISDDTRKAWRKYSRACLAFMRRGYRKACRKYPGGAYEVNRAFWDIAGAVDKALKYVDEGMVGAEYELTYVNGRAFCEEHYPD